MDRNLKYRDIHDELASQHEIEKETQNACSGTSPFSLGYVANQYFK